MEDQNATVLESLARLHAQYDMLYRELLGNGQPGRIQRLEGSMSTLERRTEKLERFRAYHMGMISCVAGVAAVIAEVVLSRLGIKLW